MLVYVLILLLNNDGNLEKWENIIEIDEKIMSSLSLMTWWLESLTFGSQLTWFDLLQQLYIFKMSKLL